ncbi:MAG: SpoIID/LytB domain-containing protein [Paludibacteraceae bacterium]|nr:SpoIID/LytB domain-containing protein [Paludibacteraceae bacterium]
MKDFELRIGICTYSEIAVNFHGKFVCGAQTFEGEQVLRSAATYQPTSEDCYFELKNVTIGVHFHWQRNENQCFKGALECVAAPEGGWIAVNRVPLEVYLTSVISSEMSATSSLELLKAHAIISRSWAMYQLFPTFPPQAPPSPQSDRIIRWYDREGHTLFDLCADDHCQRYQGITRQTSAAVEAAIEATRGMVLAYDNRLCDARFYKCCGGVTEAYESAWDDTPHPYLVKVSDTTAPVGEDLRQEAGFRRFLLASPAACCNTRDRRILSQVLNHYDQETADFYRWEVRYTQAQLSDLVQRKSGIDFGLLEDLIPLKRGVSGRIIELEIRGTKATCTVGKELEIRKWLSESHLYSSAFVVDRGGTDFVLRGAGWGHGVGLCQIGAAVMADQGMDYKVILQHYYPGTTLRPLPEILPHLHHEPAS